MVKVNNNAMHIGRKSPWDGKDKLDKVCGAQTGRFLMNAGEMKRKVPGPEVAEGFVPRSKNASWVGDLAQCMTKSMADSPPSGVARHWPSEFKTMDFQSPGEPDTGDESPE